MGEKDHLKIKIGNRLIGSGEPAYLIAEMSANHAGSIERAKEIIHAAKESGADCIKIQTYTPDTLTIDCHNKYFQVNNGTWEGENLYSLYGKAYTPWEWQPQLKAEADKVGIDFLSTPFDNTASTASRISSSVAIPVDMMIGFPFDATYSTSGRSIISKEAIL